MYKLESNKNYFIKELNKNFNFGNNKFKLDTIKNLTNYFKMIYEHK